MPDIARTFGDADRDNALHWAIHAAQTQGIIWVIGFVFNQAVGQGEWACTPYASKLRLDFDHSTIRYILPGGEVTKLS